MDNFHIFDFLPLWITFFCVIIFILSSAWLGVSIVHWRGNYMEKEDGSINTIVGANLALLAFILAFTFSLATSRFDARKLYFLQE